MFEVKEAKMVTKQASSSEVPIGTLDEDEVDNEEGLEDGNGGIDEMELQVMDSHAAFGEDSLSRSVVDEDEDPSSGMLGGGLISRMISSLSNRIWG